MQKSYVEWKGRKYPVRTLDLPEEWDYYNPVSVADVELWCSIEEECNNGNKEAEEIDNSIFYYCDSGFVDSDPTDEEIIKYLQNAGI